MKPREFDRLFRGFLIREELQWSRSRLIVGALSGKRVEQIKPLPILDAIAKVDQAARLEETETHRRLQELAKRLMANGKL